MALPTKLLAGFTSQNGAASGATPQLIPWGPVAWSDALSIGVMLSAAELASDLTTWPGAQSTTNGTAWTVRTIPQESGSFYRRWLAVGVEPVTGRFVAVGTWTDGVFGNERLSVAYSANGTSWTLGTVSGVTIINTGGTSNQGYYCGLAFGGGKALFSSIIDTDGDRYLSLVTADGGATWTAVEIDSPVYSAAEPKSPAWSSDDAVFLVVGGDPLGTNKHFLYTSAAGASWTTVELADNADVYYGVVYDSVTPQLVIYGSGGVWTGATVAALTRTALATPAQLDRLFFFGADVRYVGTRSNGAAASAHWWQTSDLSEWTSQANTGQIATVYLARATSLDKIIGGYFDEGSGPLAGGTVVLSEMSGSAPPIVTGLSHLEGQLVSVVADGVVLASPNNPAYDPITVTGGTITLPAGTYTSVTVGLPITSDIQTLDLDLPNSTTKPGKCLVTAVGAYVEDSLAFFAGPEEPTTATNLVLPAGGAMQTVQVLDRNETAVTTPTSGFRMLNFEGRWDQSGSVFIRHVDPTPLTVLALVPYGTFPR